MEAWHNEGKSVSQAMFSQADFIIGNSAACYDLVNRIVTLALLLFFMTDISVSLFSISPSLHPPSVCLPALLSSQETIEQAVLATSMGKMYFMSRGPSQLLEVIQNRTSSAAPYALSIHLSSDEYPKEILTQAALRGYKTVAVIHENSDNYFFSTCRSWMVYICMPRRDSFAALTDTPHTQLLPSFSLPSFPPSLLQLTWESVLRPLSQMCQGSPFADGGALIQAVNPRPRYSKQPCLLQ